MAELCGLVLFATVDGPDIRAVEADDSMLDILAVEVVGLLTQDFADGHEPPFLVPGQVYGGLKLAAQTVSLSGQFAQRLLRRHFVNIPK